MLDLRTGLIMPKEIRVPYSDSQANAWIDSCLYGMPYGMEMYEREHIQSQIQKLGYKSFKHKDFDNKNFEHVVIVDGI